MSLPAMDTAGHVGGLSDHPKNFVSAGSQGRQRGLFPFPLPSGGDLSGCKAKVSRTVARRLEARSHADQWVQDIVWTVNCMFAGEESMGSFVGNGSTTLSQRLCLDRVKEAVYSAGKPDVSGSEALGELRSKPPYGGEPSSVVSLDLDKVSLPAAGSEAASLQSILGSRAENFVKRLESKVLPESVVRDRKAASALKKPYFDPILKAQPRMYALFCRRLFDAGLIEYRQQVKKVVGAFCVKKKENRQRLVIDSRLANLHFCEPESVRLCTGSTFAKIEVGDSGGPIEVGGVDISDAFYNIGLPESLRAYFGLAPVRARDVGVTRCVDGEVRPLDYVYPTLKVTPMGWTHALWICQRCHEITVDEMPEIAKGTRMVDRKPVPGLSPFVHTEYVDNFVALSQKPGLVYELASAVGRELNRRGLPTHEVEAGQGGDTLGWSFDSHKPYVKITPKRMWRLRLATLELIKIGRADGKLIEKLVGHFTFAGLLQRGLLSVFQACYSFIRKHYGEEVQLWPEVQRELFWAASLICLVKKDLSAPWSNTVHATDASFWGRGVVAVERDPKEVQQVGQLCDRWKFNQTDEGEVIKTQLLSSVQDLDVEALQAPHLAEQALSETPVGSDFQEVPAKFIGKGWRKIDGTESNQFQC